MTVEYIDQIICRGSYDVTILAKFIGAVKYRGWSAAQVALPEILSPILQYLPTDAVLIPLPLHPQRHRERGFNQSECIARAIARTMDLPMSPILRRVRPTQQQAKLTEVDRAKNMRDAFQISKDVPHIPPIGILVDDVITTGATVREAAAVLHTAGMKKIIVVTIAKG